MAQTYTAKGTNHDKADTTSLSVNSVAMAAGSTIQVGVVFFAAAGNPTVKWGKKSLTRIKTNEHSTALFRTQLYQARVPNPKTLNVVCTWGTSTPGARAMYVTQITEGSVEDISVVNDNDASTTPNTSSAGTSTVAKTISIALFGSNGPSIDTVGTAGLGHTLGQRVGTSGGTDISNVTIQETYEILTATGTIRASLSGVTARDWANLIVAFKSAGTYKVTVGSSFHYTPKAYPHMESAIMDIEDAVGDPATRVRVPAYLWTLLSAAQKEEYIFHCCQWHAEWAVDANQEIIPVDDALETDLASYEGNTYEV